MRNRDALASSRDHELALDCIEAAIDAAAPEAAVRSNVGLDGDVLTVRGTDYDLARYDEVLLVGGGKAAGGVARTLESMLGDRLSDGLVVTKQPVEAETVRSAVGDHPLPSERNVAATADLLELVDAADERTLVLSVLTGGASALLTAPAGELAVSDLRETTERLLEGGVPIGEINAVRKHLSTSKGGQLASRASPATVVGLLLSDVVGDDPSVIGSGPTVPDETTFDDALAVFERYDIDPPAAVRGYLASGADGDAAETPFADDPAFDAVENHVVGGNATALDAARSVAADAGYEPLLLSSRLRGEAREAAKTLVAVGEECAATGNPVEPPAVLLGGGECTVSVAGEGGRGGPNQELVLSAALELDEPHVVAAVDTDGEDGSSDVAGAVADDSTATDAEDARAHLAANDAGTYLSDAGATIRTGPTGTNVNDVVVVVVPE
nr:DUF4147 domain-containing protein [Halopelagius longus]